MSILKEFYNWFFHSKFETKEYDKRMQQAKIVEEMRIGIRYYTGELSELGISYYNGDEEAKATVDHLRCYYMPD
jgi:hypothetical protein